MKRIALAAAALSMMAAPAFAQVTSNTFDLNGTVSPACSMPALGGTYNIDIPVDANGYVNGGDQGFTTIADLGALTSGMEVWCNTASSVTVSGTRLVHENYPINTGVYGLPGGQFTHTIPMRLANFSFGGPNGVSWGENQLNTGTTLDVKTGGVIGSDTKTSAAHFAGGVSGQLQIWNADRRPIAGDYRAQWSVTVSPN